MPLADDLSVQPADTAQELRAFGKGELGPDTGAPSQDALPALDPTKADVRPGLPALAVTPASFGENPHAVRNWFDGLMDSAIPKADGTLATARRTADVLARLAKADNTRRAYRAGVRAWCAWCDKHGLPALPASPADVAAFLSEQRYPAPPAKPLGVNTLKLRAAALRYLGQKAHRCENVR